jgi:hypothetical protein
MQWPPPPKVQHRATLRTDTFKPARDTASSHQVTTAVTTGSIKAGQTEKRTNQPSREGFAASTLHLAATHTTTLPHLATTLHLARQQAHPRLIGDGVDRRCHGVLPPEELRRDKKPPYAPDLAGQIWGTTITGRTPTTQKGRKNLDYYRRRLTSAATGRHRRRERCRLGPAHSFALETTVAKRECPSQFSG